jgi:transposase
MVKTRHEFTPEFKCEAVALLESSGRPQMQIGAELGIQPSMLRHWRTTLNGVSLRPPPASLPGAALRLVEIHRELMTAAQR